MTDRHFACERVDLVDSATNVPVIQWTSGPDASQHLYFTSPSVTLDDRWLVFLSNRNGHPNLYALDRCDGTIRRVSDNGQGMLKSYVYPQGGARGLSKASPCLDPIRNRLFYLQDGAVYAVHLDDEGEEEYRAGELPADVCTAFTHISPDGKTLCVPCTDARAFVDPATTQWEQMDRVVERVEREKLRSSIYLFDVATGARTLACEVPFWVTHVQFDPRGTGRIVFNREGLEPGTGRPLPNRIWCLEPDGATRPLSPEPEGEWRSHENWTPDGSAIVYHGSRETGPFLAARSWEGKLLREASIEGIRIYHATAAPDGRRLVVDRPDGFISLVDPDSMTNRVVDLCRHDSSFKHQDVHAHPLVSPNGKSLIFTSDRSGSGQVYEVAFSERTK